MMGGYTDDDEEVPFSEDSTSREAAESMVQHVGASRREVWVLIAISDEGLTCDGVEAITGGRHQTISARVNELMNSGMIEQARDSDGVVVTRATRSGRQAKVWVITRG